MCISVAAISSGILVSCHCHLVVMSIWKTFVLARVCGASCVMRVSLWKLICRSGKCNQMIRWYQVSRRTSVAPKFLPCQARCTQFTFHQPQAKQTLICHLKVVLSMNNAGLIPRLVSSRVISVFLALMHSNRLVIRLQEHLMTGLSWFRVKLVSWRR